MLNAVLLAGCVLAGWRLQRQREEREQRQAAFLNAKATPPAAPVVALPQPPPQVSAAQYLTVATKLLLSRDRNPNVIMEVAQPKPVPPLPVYFGLMNFGDEPRVVLALPGGAQKSYAAGDTIGEFVVAAIEPAGLVFRWEDREIRKRYDELRPKQEMPQAQPQQSAGGAAPQPMPQAAPAAAAVSRVQESKGPGEELSPRLRRCLPNDSYPPGAVVDGYKKLVNRTPFGEVCRWEKVD